MVDFWSWCAGAVGGARLKNLFLSGKTPRRCSLQQLSWRESLGCSETISTTPREESTDCSCLIQFSSRTTPVTSLNSEQRYILLYNHLSWLKDCDIMPGSSVVISRFSLTQHSYKAEKDFNAVLLWVNSQTCHKNTVSYFNSSYRSLRLHKLKTLAWMDKSETTHRWRCLIKQWNFFRGFLFEF